MPQFLLLKCHLAIGLHQTHEVAIGLHAYEFTTVIRPPETVGSVDVWIVNDANSTRFKTGSSRGLGGHHTLLASVTELSIEDSADLQLSQYQQPRYQPSLGRS